MRRSAYQHTAASMMPTSKPILPEHPPRKRRVFQRPRPSRRAAHLDWRCGQPQGVQKVAVFADEDGGCLASCIASKR